jgi:MarR family transcriptional regulator, organic hydroperoxide resistance regulator
MILYLLLAFPVDGMRNKDLFVPPQKMKSYWCSQMNKMLKGKDFSSSQVAFILTIGDNEGLSMKDVCSTLGADKGLTTRVIRALIEKGLVVNRSESSRTYKLHLTEAGREAYELSTDVLGKALEQLLEGLDEKDIEDLRRITKKIERRIDDLYQY